MKDLLAGDVDWDCKEWGSEYERWIGDDGQRIEYRDWNPATSKLVSGPYGRFKFPGKWFPDRKSARRYWLMRSGRILEEHFVPGRWIFRIPNEADGIRLQRREGTGGGSPNHQ